MKIFILKVPDILMPRSQAIRYPQFNDDYGVEQDFFEYLSNNPKLLVDDPRLADWHYLPVYWTRWHLNHEYAKTGLRQLGDLVDQAIINSRKTFTICQYDDGPVIDVKGIKVFLSSRKSKKGIDIPLLCKSHNLPYIRPLKTLKASFMGRLSTYPIRQEMAETLKRVNKVKVFDGNFGSGPYIRTILKSHVSLCPRGYGGSSFRFFESMQLGVVPFLIGADDTRPFKKFINWQEISLYTASPVNIPEILDKYTDRELVNMGRLSKSVWESCLSYQKWCIFALKELE